MKRVLLKLSGEALAGEKHTGFDEATVIGVAKQVKVLVDDGIQVGIATYLMSRVQDHRYKRVNTILRDTGFWDYAASLHLNRGDYEAAIDMAPSVKPFRHTYLHEEKYRKLAKQILREDEVLGEVFR